MEDIIEIEGYTYHKMVGPCAICCEHGIADQTIWTHKDCGGNIYIGNDANLFCERCQQRKHISKHKRQCPVCSDDTTGEVVFFEDTQQCSAEMLSYAGQRVGLAGIAWLKKFMENLD